MHLRYNLQKRRLLKHMLIRRFSCRARLERQIYRGVMRSSCVSQVERGWAGMRYGELSIMPILARLHNCCGYSGSRRSVSKNLRLSRGMLRDGLSSGNLWSYGVVSK